eukprot:775091-Rhodomonas_salina.3
MGTVLRGGGVQNVVCWEGDVTDAAAMAFNSLFYWKLTLLYDERASSSSSSPSSSASKPSAQETARMYKEAFNFGRFNVEVCARGDAHSKTANTNQVVLLSYGGDELPSMAAIR